MLRTLLVPLDGSALAERALPAAFDLARRTGGTVHLVRAHAPLAIIGATTEGLVTQEMLSADDHLRARAKAYVDDVAQRLGKEWDVRTVTHVDDGSASGLITDVAEQVLADLIVMTTHGQGGFAPGWLGSVADAVIRHSHRPVLALPEADVPARAAFTPRTILVTLDGSDTSRAIIPAARDLAMAVGARIAIVRVVAPYVPMDAFTTLTADRLDAFSIDMDGELAKREIDAVRADFEKAGVHATATVLEELSPTRTLLEHIKASDPDCIAIATQGRGLSRLFVGSVADKLIRNAGRPALVLRPARG
jgi:nucleotide-binding universal stress UspA family protein